MQLKEDLSLIQHGSKPVSEYLDFIRFYADELALIIVPLSNNDITIYFLNGLGLEFLDISASTRAHENPIFFEELRELLNSHKHYLKRLKTTSVSMMATENISQHGRFRYAHSSIPKNPISIYRSQS